MNVVLILFDSLNKDFLGCYGNTWVKTPNFDRLAKKSMVFDNHFVGSLPCVPARRDMLTGRQEFMFRGWGCAEPWDEILVKKIKKMGIETGIVTDHYHYWNANDGYGYTQNYNYMEYIRGTECDNHGYIQEKDDLCKAIDRYRKPFESALFVRNKETYKTNEDFTCHQVFKKANEYLDFNHDKHFFLHVEEFNPHEPFYFPEKWRNMYENFNVKFTIWPPYQDEESANKFKNNHLQGEPEFIVKQYAGGVSYVDYYLGKLLDKFDQYNLWENTMIILTSDHGHELFEKGKYGKSYPYYLTVSNIPLIIYHPKYPAQHINAITQTVDLYQTILKALNEKENSTYLDSKDILSVVDKKTLERTGASFGWFGRGVGYVDNEYFYVSGCDNSKPLYWYSSIPKMGGVGVELEKCDFANATSGKFIKGVDYPVWKIPAYARNDIKQEERLYLRSDTKQLNPIKDENKLKICRKRLLKLLKENNSPEENIDRLNLK